MPKTDVYRRFERSMKNFKNVIKKVDYWELRYNGNENCEVVARGTGDILDILDDALYNKFKKESK